MLFNSITFIFVFLPITLLVFLWAKRTKRDKWSIVWLVAASLFFYGYWNPPYLGLILSSIVFNYTLGSALNRPALTTSSRKVLLGLGIVCNLGAIGYFKYAGFFVATVNDLLNTGIALNNIVLPLAISFFTFQQIAYLVDSYKQKTAKYAFLDYTLFVTFFPQLIAGPIVQHDDIIPQFYRQATQRLKAENIAIGLTIFMMGLFKKMVFADGIAGYASLTFSMAENEIPLTFLEAWVGALAYTLQLYFDFSGYSDMAIGAAKAFGITLPLNFNSPYKAVNIIDFWRRWHITLSHFLRDYLYIPLGGNRRGEFQRSVNLMITMLLGGLWHGAGWAFVLWGGLHGLYLIVNHQWRAFRKFLGHNIRETRWLGRWAGQLVTFVAVVIGWVFFKAGSTSTALVVLKGMSGLNGVSLGDGLSAVLSQSLSMLGTTAIRFDGFLPNMPGVSPKNVVLSISLLLLVTWFAPNTQQWIAAPEVELAEAEATESLQATNESLQATKSLQTDRLKTERLKPVTNGGAVKPIFRWQPTQAWATVSAIATVFALLHLTRVSEFLYFEF